MHLKVMMCVPQNIVGWICGNGMTDANILRYQVCKAQEQWV